MVTKAGSTTTISTGKHSGSVQINRRNAKRDSQYVHPKVMLSIWWYAHGPVLWQVLYEGATVTANLYTQQLRDLMRIVDQRVEEVRRSTRGGSSRELQKR
ncbi:hypothetical protein OSTOST_07562 [Ostertagia ostertagi]